MRKQKDTCRACAPAPCAPGRSESRRASRRFHEAKRYKRADKATVIERLTAEQKGVCLVCSEPGHELGNGTKGLVLDHCHTTGEPRALLCGRCNAALGLMRESALLIDQLRCYAEMCALLRA